MYCLTKAKQFRPRSIIKNLLLFLLDFYFLIFMIMTMVSSLHPQLEVAKMMNQFTTHVQTTFYFSLLLLMFKVVIKTLVLSFYVYLFTMMVISVDIDHHCHPQLQLMFLNNYCSFLIINIIFHS